MCFVLNQFFIVHTIPCATFHGLTQTIAICFNCYYPLHFFCIHNTIVQKMLITEIFKPQLFSSHVTCLHTRLIDSFPIILPAMFCLLYCRLNSLQNALEEEYLCLPEISINVNSFTACCCCLFTWLSPVSLYWCCCYIFVHSLLFLKLWFIILRTQFPFS